jgi:hypothetical protein
MKVRRGGAWRDITACHVYRSGKWRRISVIKAYVGAQWRTVASFTYSTGGVGSGSSSGGSSGGGSSGGGTTGGTTTGLVATASPSSVVTRGSTSPVISRAVTITPSGGKAPYTYAWNGGEANASSPTTATTTFSVTLSFGSDLSTTATCTVTDSLGRTASAECELTFFRT